MVNIGINGYGVIGRRVADAIALQDDMKLVGIAKTESDYKTKIAVAKGIPIYASEDIKKFEGSGIKVKGTLEEMLGACDLVVDCTPEEIGAANKPLYEKYKCKVIWQGGEEHELTGKSFNAYANYNSAKGARFMRVVSCNTTGLIRTLYPLQKEIGIETVKAFMIRRAADPSETKKGPINAIEPEKELPSHHGLDVRTVMPELEIETAAAKVPTTLMHLHYVTVKLNKKVDKDKILSTWRKYNRIILFSFKDGVKSTAQVMDYARDIGRPRGDLYEIAVWDSIRVKDDTLNYFQAVHQESDVIPENVDAIRAMFDLESQERSIAKTDKSLGIISR